MWAVVMWAGSEEMGTRRPMVYLCDGPDRARRFAEFLTAEVDPAVAVPVSDPVAELLGWREEIAAPTFARLGQARKLATDWVTSGDPMARNAGHDLDEALAGPPPAPGEGPS